MSAAQTGVIRVEPTRKRIRALLDGELVADTTNALLVWEIPYYPAYYLPSADVRAELLPAGTADAPGLGTAEVLTVKVATATAEAAARRYPDAPDPRVRACVRLDWNAMTEWLEEDEPNVAHPRDPFHRIDVLASSRHVRLELDGHVLAESSRPMLLFETMLPVRYYLPREDLRAELSPSGTRTYCAYKGQASYWSVTVGDRAVPDIAWTYQQPLHDAAQVRGLTAFFDERVDVVVDGERHERPITPWSPGPRT